MRLAGIAVLLAAALAAIPPEAAAKLPCSESDKACLFKAAQANPVRRFEFWTGQLSRPVAERIGPAPPELVDYLEIDNALQGFPQKPRVAKLSPDFLADANGAFADLLAILKPLVGPTLAGVYFVEDLGGSGYTDLVRDDGRPAAAYVVLDAKVLAGFKANAWATWKENTPFKPGNGWKLEATIEEPAEDTRRSAIRYILLHELGHVVAATRNLHPPWDVPVKDLPANGKWPFFDLSWVRNAAKGRYDSKFDATFTARPAIVYYLGARLEAKAMSAVYRELDRTNFPTLYAATHPGDDFAESFASYVHSVKLGRPWSIRITKDGKPDLTFRLCWDDPRCIEKREILETLLR